MRKMRPVRIEAARSIEWELPIHPESQKKFSCEAANAQITFVTDGTGRPTGLVFQHDDRDLRAQRVE
jgi:hypothetical protein